MRGSATPVLLLFLALLVVGAAVYFAFKPASATGLEVAGPPDASLAERPAHERTSAVPAPPPRPGTPATAQPR